MPTALTCIFFNFRLRLCYTLWL